MRAELRFRLLDGLTECVDSKTIADILRNARSADEACRALIDAALRGGGTDNVTVILARYRFPQTPSEQLAPV